ncbi:unnamed protein product, partial [Cuscuta epithymum]
MTSAMPTTASSLHSQASFIVDDTQPDVTTAASIHSSQAPTSSSLEQPLVSRPQHFMQEQTILPSSAIFSGTSPHVSSYSPFSMPEPFTWQPTLHPFSAATSAAVQNTASSLPFNPIVGGQFDVGSSSRQQHHSPSGFGNSTSFLTTMASQLTFSTPNVTNIVTTRLASVEDYLPWKTQFESFLVSHNLVGVLDGTIPIPSPFVLDASRREIMNTDYQLWLKIDQTVRSWLFATLSRDILIDVHELKFSYQIWDRLKNKFMSASTARSMEIKRQLSTKKKKANQTMDQYLREIKVAADSLALINSPVSDKDLIEYTLLGLGPEFESILGGLAYIPPTFTFDQLGPILELQEHRLQYMRGTDAPLSQHQAFVVAGQTSSSSQVRPQNPYQGRGGAQPRGGRGGRGQRSQRGHRGRGRGYGYPGAPGQQPYPRGYDYQYAGHHAFHTPGAPGAGFPSVDHTYASPPPPVVCQLCFTPGHSAITCSKFTSGSSPALAALLTGETTEATWYPDSGASAHMTPSEGILQNKSIITNPTNVQVANDTNLSVSTIGNVHLPSLGRPLCLKSVYHVPQLKFNLMSIQKLCEDNDCTAIFNKSSFFVKDNQTGATLLHASNKNRTYPFTVSSSPLALFTSSAPGSVWHKRLGHCGDSILSTLRRTHSLFSSTNIRHLCTSCRLGKSHRLPFQDVFHIANAPLQLIHSDVW